MFPLTVEKQNHPSLLKASDYIKGKKKVPQSAKRAILCFSPSVARKLSQKYQATTLFTLGARFDFYKKEDTLVVSQFGRGAPASVLQLEHLIALNIQEFWSVGVAGGFGSERSLGEVVFIKEAYRDEGCSYHYKKDISSVKNLNENRINKWSCPHVKSWTTDAPYRETLLEFEKWEKEGLSCVEMEASALMIVAEYYSKPLFCFAVISDLIKDKKWDMGFSHSVVQDKLLSLSEKLLFYYDEEHGKKIRL